MGKASAKAYSNIALVKYWGKKDSGLRLPVNSSLAFGLDKIFTKTTVEFDEKYEEDLVEIDGDVFGCDEVERVVGHLDLVRKMAKSNLKARVVTRNNFPKRAGAASSASGFAALSLAASRAAGLKLNERELSILARKGSGSASRSIPGGVSVWHTSDADEDSYAEGLGLPKEWDLRVLLVFVADMGSKKIGSTEAMELTKQTSPYFAEAIAQAKNNMKRLKSALEEKSFEEFGRVVEDECYRLHMLCMTTKPNILYWRGETVEVFRALLELREVGVGGYFTVDAGPHVHVICKSKDVVKIKKAVEKIGGINSVVECGISGPAELIDKHLF